MNDRECPGPTLERCARVLGVKVEQLRLVGEGANGLIVSDGSGVAYKFPKNRIALQSLKEEITYTKKLSHVLSVAVPGVSAGASGAAAGRSFLCLPLAARGEPDTCYLCSASSKPFRAAVCSAPGDTRHPPSGSVQRANGLCKTVSGDTAVSFCADEPRGAAAGERSI